MYKVASVQTADWWMVYCIFPQEKKFSQNPFGWLKSKNAGVLKLKTQKSIHASQTSNKSSLETCESSFEDRLTPSTYSKGETDIVDKVIPIN